MTQSQRSRVLVLGGGPGGYVAALRAAVCGADVTLVESGELGGVCLNEGCIPSKILLHAGETLMAARAAPWLTGADAAGLDLATLQVFKSGTIDRLRTGIDHLLRSRKVKVLRGTGRFIGPHTLLVDGKQKVEVEFDSAIIATGSRAVELASLPFDGDQVVHARHVLEWETIPATTAIIGGGAIGIELATFLSAAGSTVTLIEAQPEVLGTFDRSVAGHVLDALKGHGVQIMTGTRVGAVADGTVTCTADSGEVQTVKAEKVVVAVGRTPLVPDLGPLDLRRGLGGHLVVDHELRTSVPYVFAIGDVTEGPALAHRASAQAKAAGASAAGQVEPFQPQFIPAVVYSTPELARVGMTLREATAAGHTVATRAFPLSSNGRALGLAATGGGLAIHDEATGLLLGYELAGPAAGEIIGGLTIALEMGAVVQDLADSVQPHPSISEVTNELADLALGLGTHAG